MISVTFHHKGHGSTIVNGEDEARYAQLFHDQGIEVVSITREMACEACLGSGQYQTPYCKRLKPHKYHGNKCRRPCTECHGRGGRGIGTGGG